ncbi:MAG: flagellar motor protein MotB [Colwellia sp.]
MRCAGKKSYPIKMDRRENARNENVHRWLISYADYMTLMFALFVVLYAMALVNEEPFEAITESLGKVFLVDKNKPLRKEKGDDILPVQNDTQDKILHGNNIVLTKSDIVDSDSQENNIIIDPSKQHVEKDLSNVSNEIQGEQLIALEETLNTSLDKLLTNELVTIELKGDWLEIGLSSGLLFPSGSSSLISSAEPILIDIFDVLKPINNFVRIRGYTDNQPINTEIFISNWELSVYRATSVLKVFERLTMQPSRMAIEGYGQYQPVASNNTEQGRAKNRRVVIAVSKFGIEK